MKRLALIFVLMLGGCQLINRAQSPTDLLVGLCWKQTQQPGSLDALFSTPQGKCAAYVACKKVGVFLDYGAQYCQQVGMRNIP